HHGWVGENPNAYSTDRRIHAFVDTDILQVHGLGYDSLRTEPAPARTVDPKDPWDNIVEHVSRSFEQVEPLYRLEKDGRLKGPDGKRFIADRLLDGAAMLGALYKAAGKSSAPTEGQISSFVKYNNLDGAAVPAAAGTGPAGGAPVPVVAPDPARQRRPRRRIGGRSVRRGPRIPSRSQR